MDRSTKRVESPGSAETGEQGACADEVGSFPAFGDRVVGGSEQLARLPGATPFPPQPRQRACGAQLQRLRLLSARDLESAEKGGLRLGGLRPAGEQQLGAQAMKLRVPPALVRLAAVREAVFHHLETGPRLAGPEVGVREECQVVRQAQPPSRLLEALDGAPQVPEGGVLRPSERFRVGDEDRRPCPIVGGPELRGELERLLRLPPEDGGIGAELLEQGEVGGGDGLAERLGELSGQAQRPGTRRRARRPDDPGTRARAIARLGR